MDPKNETLELEILAHGSDFEDDSFHEKSISLEKEFAESKSSNTSSIKNECFETSIVEIDSDLDPKSTRACTDSGNNINELRHYKKPYIYIRQLID